MIKQIIDFLGCMLQGSCIYSIKKFLAYMTFMLITYLAVFTDKSYYDLLFFLAALLAIRSYDKEKYHKNKDDNQII